MRTILQIRCKYLSGVLFCFLYFSCGGVLENQKELQQSSHEFCTVSIHTDIPSRLEFLADVFKFIHFGERFQKVLFLVTVVLVWTEGNPEKNCHVFKFIRLSVAWPGQTRMIKNFRQQLLSIVNFGQTTENFKKTLIDLYENLRTFEVDESP